MPIFELESGGKQFEVDAPDMNAAVSAFKQFSGVGSASSEPSPQKKSFGERLGEVWENPGPGGVFDIAKRAYQGAVGSVGSSIDAVSGPSGNEMNLRDLGPGYGMEAASVVSPMSRAGGWLGVPQTAKSTLPQIAPEIKSPLLDAAKNIGVDIPNYLATDSMAVQRIASGFKNIPIAGDKIVKSATALNENLGQAARTVSEGLGTGSVDVAGGMAKDAMSQWIKKGSKAPLDDAYKEVDALVNPEFRGPLTSTADEVSKIMAERANAKIGGKSGAVSAVLPAVQSEGLNYAGAKDLRTFLGPKTPQELIAKGIDPIEAKRLYKALSADLEGIVTNAGGDAAATLWKEANALNVATAIDRKQLAKIIGATGDAAPEAVYSKLVSYAGSKSSADISRLMLARKTMGDEAWSEVASAVVARLGRDAQGQFSPDRFSTAYGNLSAAGKNTMFGGKTELAKSLDDINTVVTAIKDKIGRFANTSGTTQTAIGAGMIGAVMAEPLTLITTVVGGKVMAEMLAKPATAKATADYSKAYLAALEKPNKSKQLMIEVASRNLIKVMESSNIRNVDVATFLRTLGTVPAPANDKQNRVGGPSGY
jgi:hypothetical protein